MIKLPGKKQFTETKRKKNAYYRMGEGNEKKLILIHGNVSGSAFYLPLMQRLSGEYDVVAADLNGYGKTEISPIDAKTGLLEWAKDVDALSETLGFDKFSLLGWSLGGGVAMRYAIEYSQKLNNLMLINPVSPFGFGGTYEADGKMFDEKGTGCLGGFVNNDFMNSLKSKDRGDGQNTIRFVMNNHYFKPGFKVDAEFEEFLIDEMFDMQIGTQYYAGDFEPLGEFPYALPGKSGFNNTLAPQFCNLSAIADIPNKPNILWFRGDSDVIVADNSYYDVAFLGKIGAVPGYPGEDKMPPQPMLEQTRYVLDKYKVNGGKYKELIIGNAGHGCFLEQEDEFVKLFAEHMK